MNNPISLSFEYFPARTEAAIGELEKVQTKLNQFNPEYVSVTYGAGGTTQVGTYYTVSKLLNLGARVAPHITCVGSTKVEMRELLESYIQLGVNRFVVLRGDLPKDINKVGDYKFASDLIQDIRKQFGEQLILEVAAYPEFHPESISPKSDLEKLKLKFKMGADAAITQYFYNADAYFSLLEDAQILGINKPIIPGIMPITNYKTLVRFSDNCGTEIPRWVRSRLHQYRDDQASLVDFGLDVVTQLCQKLVDNGVSDFHFYTLNAADPIRKICNSLVA